MLRVITASEAVALVPGGATVAISGGGYRVVPEALINALAERFLAEGRPSGLTIVAIAMLERGRRGKGGADTGLNRLATPGLMTKVITSSFSRSSAHELNLAIVLAGEIDDAADVFGRGVNW